MLSKFKEEQQLTESKIPLYNEIVLLYYPIRASLKKKGHSLSAGSGAVICVIQSLTVVMMMVMMVMMMKKMMLAMVMILRMMVRTMMLMILTMIMVMKGEKGGLCCGLISILAFGLVI